MAGNMVYQKTYGALMGVAIGDAMGMPGELWPREKIRHYFKQITWFLPAPEDNEVTRGLKAGQVTDDTHLTLLMADTIIKNCGQINPAEIIARIMKWAENTSNQYLNIIGPSTRKAYDQYKAGISLNETGKTGITNGGAMKMIPVGVISRIEKIDELIENVRLACLPTHNTSIAISGAAAIAAAVSYGIEGGSCLSELIEIAKLASEKGEREGTKVIGASVAARLELGIKIIEEAKNEDEALQKIYEVIGAGLLTNEAVPAAIALVYLAEADPVKCAILSANLGGDTDTIGAIACGICGAIKGIESIPEEYTSFIIEKNKLDLAGTAKELAALR